MPTETVFMTLSVKEHKEGVTFSVKVVPGSSRTRIAGPYGQALKINLAAAPEKGKANKELVKLLAETLGLPNAAVEVTSGTTQPLKEITIYGIKSHFFLEKMAQYLI